MVKQKQIEGERKQLDLWKEKLVEPIPMNQYAKETAETEKIILFGESSTGKTRWYLNILEKLKRDNIPKEKFLMCLIYPDRPTGVTKLYNLIPKEYVGNILVFPISKYEELVSSTAVAEQKLKEHFQKTGYHGWLICELLNEMWTYAQDYYSRQAYGESLADYLTLQRESVREKMRKIGKEDKETIWQSLGGFTDWVAIKFFHNFNWIDRIKKMPFNVLFTAEIKAENNKDSIFSTIGVRPAGEKDNMHRTDTILYLKHEGNKFTQQCFKLTGYSRLYSEIDVTDKNGYEVHKKILKQFESKGYRSSAIEELEEEAGITPPKQVPKEIKVDVPSAAPKVEPKPAPVEKPPEHPKEIILEAEKKTPIEPPKVEPEKPKVEEKKEIVKAEQTPEGAHDALEDHEKMALEKADIKTITISKTPEGEKVEQISKEELVAPTAKKKEEKKEPVDDFDWSV